MNMIRHLLIVRYFCLIKVMEMEELTLIIGAPILGKMETFLDINGWFSMELGMVIGDKLMEEEGIWKILWMIFFVMIINLQ